MIVQFANAAVVLLYKTDFSGENKVELSISINNKQLITNLYISFSE